MGEPLAGAVAGIVLAAGRAARMGRNKLLCELGGVPLILLAVDAALGAGLSPVIVVTGHDAGAVTAALHGRAVRFAHNAEHAQGMASSIRTGVRALAAGCSGAVVLLGDMPRVRAEHVRALLDAFERAGRRAICVPEHGGRRGNPVLWPASELPALASLSGDRGGRDLLAARAERLLRVAMPDDAVLIDVDAPQALAELQARGAPGSNVEA